MPADAARRKWAALQVPPRVAVASPYAGGDEAAVRSKVLGRRDVGGGRYP